MSADVSQRFIFEHASIRGEIVHIEQAYHDIIDQRNYPPMIKNLIGEALVSCLLLASGVKFEGSLNLQFQGDPRIPLLLAQCDQNLNIRAYAKYTEDLDNEDYADAFLNGKMMISINQPQQTLIYQSKVPIQSTSMAENLMNYFALSEQISTKIWLAVDDDKAAGMLLQLMPGKEQEATQREEFWEYAVQLGQTISEAELLNLDNQTILHRLYHETEIRLFDMRPIAFQCRCTPEKMKQVLRVFGKHESDKLLENQEKVTINCDFCNTQYSFDPIDVTLLFPKTV